MLVTLDGIEMDVNDAPAKASAPISLTPFGISTAPEQSLPSVTTPSMTVNASLTSLSARSRPVVQT